MQDGKGVLGLDSPPTPAADVQRQTIEQKLKYENGLKGGASWFFWVAGLSFVNSVMMMSGSGWHFFAGLGTTFLVDAISFRLGTAGHVAALVVNLFFIGMLILLGVFARQRQKWAFVVGMVAYGLDAFVLFLFPSPILPFAFHGFALFCMYAGYAAIGRLEMTEKELTATASAQA